MAKSLRRRVVCLDLDADRFRAGVRLERVRSCRARGWSSPISADQALIISEIRDFRAFARWLLLAGVGFAALHQICFLLPRGVPGAAAGILVSAWPRFGNVSLSERRKEFPRFLIFALPLGRDSELPDREGSTYRSRA